MQFQTQSMRSLTNRFAALALAMCATCVVVQASGCKKSEPGDVKAGEANAVSTGPVAKVNGDEIGRVEFNKQFEKTRARFARSGREVPASLESRLKETIIKKLVEETLIAQKAKAESVALDPTELDVKFKEHKTKFGNDEAFKNFLTRTNQTEDDVKGELQKSALRDKLFTKLMANSEPTEADAKKQYDENLDKYKEKEKIRASHILVKVDAAADAKAKAAKLAEAKKILAEAKQTKNFEELTKKYSDGPSKERGGDLGEFSRGRMVAPFEDAAFAAAAGSVIGPVETQFGFHIIKVYEKKAERQRAFEEVKDQILTSLKARQKSKITRELLEKLKADAKVEVLEPGVDLSAKKAPPALPGGMQGMPMGKGGMPGGDPHGGLNMAHPMKPGAAPSAPPGAMPKKVAPSTNAPAAAHPDAK